MYRNISIARSKPPSTGGTVAVALFKNTTKLPAGYAALDEQLGGALTAALKRPELKVDVAAVTTLYPAQGAERLFVLGLGDGRRPIDAVRIAAAKLAIAGHQAGVKRIALHVAPAFEAKKDVTFDADAAGRAIGEGLLIGNFSFDEFKGIVSDRNGNGGSAGGKRSSTSRSKAAGKAGDRNTATDSGNGNGGGKGKTLDLAVDLDAHLRQPAQNGLIVGEAVNVARELAATPPNVANPAYLVKYCRRLAQHVGLKCTVIEKARAKQLGLNGLLAVGAAGSTPPALICLEHNPTGGQSKGGGRGGKTKSSTPTIVLVGKAITFDTGGYSLKVGGSMLGMKYDKCGGMAVIGAMLAVASLNLPVRVVGIIAAAENMIDNNAYRPNDILKMYNGVSVEVTNTDAEGRLVLADALAYGCKTYKPDAIVDLATLTGGVVVALGSACAGAFVNDAKLREHLFDAAEHTGERLWHLPLWDEYKELMKGTHSDLINSNPSKREAHPIQGAIFLSYFVAKDGDFKKNATVPWAHLDIAGVAEQKSDGPLYTTGPTGFGVRLLVRAVEMWG